MPGKDEAKKMSADEKKKLAAVVDKVESALNVLCFELKPKDSVVIELIFEQYGKEHKITHLLSGIPSLEHEMNIAREAGKGNQNDDGYQTSGDVKKAMATSWNNLIVKATGYSKDDQYTTEELIKLVPEDHKVIAIGYLRTAEAVELKNDDEFFKLENSTSDLTVEIRNGEDSSWEFIASHVMKSFEPFALSKIMAGTRYKAGSGNSMESSSVEIQKRKADFYDSYVERVDGYIVAGAPVMESENWQKLIPLHHKFKVVNELHQRVVGVEKK